MNDKQRWKWEKMMKDKVATAEAERAIAMAAASEVKGAHDALSAKHEALVKEMSARRAGTEQQVAGLQRELAAYRVDLDFKEREITQLKSVVAEHQKTLQDQSIVALKEKVSKLEKRIARKDTELHAECDRLRAETVAARAEARMERGQAEEAAHMTVNTLKFVRGVMKVASEPRSEEAEKGLQELAKRVLKASVQEMLKEPEPILIRGVHGADTEELKEKFLKLGHAAHQNIVAVDEFGVATLVPSAKE